MDDPDLSRVVEQHHTPEERRRREAWAWEELRQAIAKRIGANPDDLVLMISRPCSPEVQTTGEDGTDDGEYMGDEDGWG
jgi:hypothetical protein